MAENNTHDESRKPSGHGGKRPGAGRKRIEENPRVTVAFSLPESMVEDMDARAEKEGKSRSDLAAFLIGCGLAELEQAESDMARMRAKVLAGDTPRT